MWDLYVRVYLVLTVFYLWYRFGLLLFTDLKSRHYLGAYQGQLISVIVPFYNEEPEILVAAIASLLAARGEKEIIVVDDGSTDPAAFDVARRRFNTGLTLIRYDDNRGKREAQAVGLARASGDLIVAVDSDTVVDPDALVQLVTPLLADRSIGATTGNVRVRNRDQNLLTRMISARYWTAFGIERRSLSGAGSVTCCSGVLSAYRGELMRSLLPEYLGQRFLGAPCTYGDDRHLTNLILGEKHRAVYVHEAICYTEVPASFARFLSQQLRWKKSFLRESWVSLTFAFRHSVLLPLEVLLNLTIPFLSLAIRLALFVAVAFEPQHLPLVGLSVVTIALIRNFFLIFEDLALVPYSVFYAFVHELVIFWLYPVALFRLRDRGWGTR